MLLRETEVSPQKYRFRGVLGNGYTLDQIEILEKALQEKKSYQPLLVNTLARTNHVAYETLFELIVGAGVTPRDLLFSAKGKSLGLCITPDEFTHVKEFYSDFPDIPFAGEDVNSLGQIAASCSSTRKTIRKLIEGAEVTPQMYRFRNGKTGMGITVEQQARVKATYAIFSRD